MRMNPAHKFKHPYDIARAELARSDNALNKRAPELEIMRGGGPHTGTWLGAPLDPRHLRINKSTFVRPGHWLVSFGQSFSVLMPVEMTQAEVQDMAQVFTDLINALRA